MHTTIFYFSGTGNSLVAARMLAEKLDSAQLVALAGLPADQQFVVDSEIVVFVFPVYSAGIPVIVKKSLARIKLNGSPYICAIATCGSEAGAAIGIFADELDSACSMKLSAGWQLCMPANYTPLYGAYPDNVNQAMLTAASSRLQHLSELIRNRQAGRLETSPAPFSWLMKIVWRGFAACIGKSDRHYRASRECTGCGICEKICPVANIRLNASGRPVWQHHCEQCMACLQYCPVEAIQFCWWTKGRRRYHHPQITPAMLAAQKTQVSQR